MLERINHDQTALIGVFTGNKQNTYQCHPKYIPFALPGTADNGALPGRIFYFSLHDIDYQNYLIEGVYYDNSQGRWMKQVFPFPDVLYQRNGVPEHRKRELARFQNTIEARKIRLVNSLAEFDKWAVHQALSNYGKLKSHLPETRLFRKHSKVLEMMIRKHGRVYLKACRGRQGRQVVQVTRLPGGSYEYRYFVREVKSGTVTLFKNLVIIIENFFTGQDFIIQQPLDLIEFAGRKADLRAELQRNGRGELEVTAISVRVALEKSPITTHADSYRFEDFFTGMLDYSTPALNELKHKLHTLLFSLYHDIEDYYGPFGEIGIDIGLDKNNRLWFIECNSQPAKVSLTHAYGGGTAARAFTNPLEYALYIAGLAGR